MEDSADRNNGLAADSPVTPLPKTEASELNVISKQIKDLVKRRRDLKKGENVEDGERNKVKPLPQRIPRIRPKVVSNIQLVPPKTDFELGRVGGGETRTPTQDLDKS